MVWRGSGLPSETFAHNPVFCLCGVVATETWSTTEMIQGKQPPLELLFLCHSPGDCWTWLSEFDLGFALLGLGNGPQTSPTHLGSGDQEVIEELIQCFSSVNSFILWVRIFSHFDFKICRQYLGWGDDFMPVGQDDEGAGWSGCTASPQETSGEITWSRHLPFLFCYFWFDCNSKRMISFRMTLFYYKTTAPFILLCIVFFNSPSFLSTN